MKTAYFTQNRQAAQDAYEGAIRATGKCYYESADAILECWWQQEGYEGACETQEAAHRASYECQDQA